MIYKIKKHLYDQDEAFAIRSVIGEVVCCIKPMRIDKMLTGYYVYNREGAGIAQVTFEGSTATISIARDRGFYPGSMKLARKANGEFAFLANAMAEGDANYAAKIKGVKDSKEYSIWGNTKDYSYDIYYGKDVAVNVVRMLKDDSMFEVRIGETGNLLVCLLICLSTEVLNATAGK